MRFPVVARPVSPQLSFNHTSSLVVPNLLGTQSASLYMVLSTAKPGLSGIENGTSKIWVRAMKQ